MNFNYDSEQMSFECALNAMRQGYLVKRASWNFPYGLRDGELVIFYEDEYELVEYIWTSDLLATDWIKLNPENLSEE